MLIEHPEFHWCRSDLARIGNRGAWEWFVMTGYVSHCHVGRLRAPDIPFSWSPERNAISDKLRQLLGLNESRELQRLHSEKWAVVGNTAHKSQK